MGTTASAIVFDFDGTIADSFMVAVETLFELTHREPLPDEDITRLRAMSTRELLRALHVPLWQVPFLAWRARRKLRGRLASIDLIPGIDDAIRRLSRDHQLFVLSSNSAENVHIFLARFGIAACFADIIGNASPLYKQGPLRRLLRRNRLAAGKVWYVGDETRDVDAARRAGVQVVAVSWGYNDIGALERHHPDALVFTPEELVAQFVPAKGKPHAG